MQHNRIGALLLVAAALNGLANPMGEAVLREGLAQAAGAGFGISMLVWGSLTMGAWRLWRADTAPGEGESSSSPRPGMLSGLGLCLCAALLLLPTALTSWFAMAVLALLVLRHAPAGRAHPARVGGCILLAVAIREPVAFLALKLAAAPVLAFDAQAAALVAGLVQSDFQVTGNMVIGQDGHRLFVMTGCASFTNLSVALLGCYALSRFLHPELAMRWTILRGVVTAIAVVGLNVARLAGMSLSPDLYTLLHGPMAANVLALLILCVPAVVVIGMTPKGVRP